MNKSETAKLLGIVAAYDRRTLGEADVEAWHSAFEAGLDKHVRFEDAKKAVVHHYAESRQWLMPADLVGYIKLLRKTRRLKIPMPTPPAELVDEHGYPDSRDRQKWQAYTEWKAEISRKIENGQYRPDPPPDVLRKSMTEIGIDYHQIWPGALEPWPGAEPAAAIEPGAKARDMSQIEPVKAVDDADRVCSGCGKASRRAADCHDQMCLRCADRKEKENAA